MTEFKSIDVSGEEPPAVCHTCAANSIEHIPTGLVAAFCRHEQAGAWRINGRWQAGLQPVDAERFSDITLLYLVEGEQRYLERVLKQTAGETAH